MTLQAGDLALDGHLHDLLDAHLQAGKGARLPLETALPLAHGRHEQRRHRMGRPRGERPIELLQGLPGPERLLETVHGAPGARIKNELLDRDRPNHDRCHQEPDHHQFDHQIRVLEQIPDGKRRGGRHGISFPAVQGLPAVPPKVTKLGRKTRRYEISWRSLALTPGYRTRARPLRSWSVRMAVRSPLGMGRARPSQMQATPTCASTNSSSPRRMRWLSVMEAPLTSSGAVTTASTSSMRAGLRNSRRIERTTKAKPGASALASSNNARCDVRRAGADDWCGRAP